MCHEVPDQGVKRYSSTLSLTSALDGVGGQGHAITALPPSTERPDTCCKGGWWASGPVRTGAQNLASSVELDIVRRDRQTELSDGNKI
jgi:hypothetical protein